MQPELVTAAAPPKAEHAESAWTLGPNAPLRLLSMKELQSILSVSRSALYRAQKEQDFPAPSQLFRGTRAARYDSREVWRWVEQRLNAAKAA